MLLKTLFIPVIVLTSLFCPNPSNSITELNKRYSPEIFFFYPKGLTNGSSFIPREYMYFTLSGNCKDWDSKQFVFDSKWSTDEGYTGIEMYNGIGWVSPNSGEILWNCWHNLTMVIKSKMHGSVVKNYSFQFYADPALIEYEPFSITPINYPNNSIFPFWYGDENEFPTFKATGVNLTESSLMGDHVARKPLNCTYKWDDWGWRVPYQTFIRGGERLDYCSYHGNVFSFKDHYFNPDGQNHTLLIRLANDTYNETYRFIYTIINVDDAFWSIGSDYYLGFGDPDKHTTYGPRGNHHLSPNETLRFANFANYTTLIYDWHDGSGNHTVDWSTPEVEIRAPDFPFNETGFRYISFWYEKEGIWSTEKRFVYFYDRLIPELELIYPVNDSSLKEIFVPIIWSLKTYQQSFWDYSQYKFNVYYQLPAQEPVLLKSNYNPIVYETKTKINQNIYWYLKNHINYYLNCSDPMLLGYEFYAPWEIRMNATKIRFIINETTTPGIQGVITDWINLRPQGSSQTNNPTTTTEQTTISNSSTTSQSTTTETSFTSFTTTSENMSFFEVSVVFLILIILIGKKKGKNDY